MTNETDGVYHSIPEPRETIEEVTAFRHTSSESLPKWFLSLIIKTETNNKGRTFYTLRGDRLYVDHGDWVVRKSNGAIYSYKHHVFMKNFARHSPEPKEMIELEAFRHANDVSIPGWFSRRLIKAEISETGPCRYTLASGVLVVDSNQWVVRTKDGQFYKLEDDYFVKTFIPADLLSKDLKFERFRHKHRAGESYKIEGDNPYRASQDTINAFHFLGKGCTMPNWFLEQKGILWNWDHRGGLVMRTGNIYKWVEPEEVIIMGDVGHFFSMSNSDFSCLFHKPLLEEDEEISDWGNPCT